MRTHLHRLRAIAIPSFLILLLLSACSPSETPTVTESELTLEGGYLRHDLDLWTADGVVHTEGIWRPGALLRHDRRVIVMVPGTLANGAGYYDIERTPATEGYSAARILADENFVVVLVDLLGTGASSHPASGADLGVEAAARAVRRAALAWRLRTAAVGGVDLYGETGAGFGPVLLLAREPWVRSVVGAATFYREFGPGSAPLFDPGYRGFISSAPGGYVPQDPMFIGAFYAGADPAVSAIAIPATVGPAPQVVPSGPFLDLFAIPFTAGPGPFGILWTLEHPIVDARPAAAPALIIQGSPDPIGSEAGTAELVAEYGATGGGDATLVTIPGATHLMRFDAGISDGPESVFWSTVLDYLSAH